MSDLPSATVIVPTKNRPESLSACLGSLARQDYPRERWQLVVVNDGGADPFAAQPAMKVPGLSLMLINTAARGPAAARNRGVLESNAEWLVFLDDDCRAEPSWLRELVCGIQSSPYQACFGRTLNAFPGNRPAAAFQYFMEFYRDYARMPNTDLYLVMSNNAVYRRETFAALGGFHAGFPRPGAEDLELSHRLVAGGYRQGYLPQAILHHAHCATAADYLRRQFQYGRGFALMAGHLQREGIPLRVGQRRRPQFHLALLGAMAEKNPGLRESILIWLGILAHAAGNRWERISPQTGGCRPDGRAA